MDLRQWLIQQHYTPIGPYLSQPSANLTPHTSLTPLLQGALAPIWNKLAHYHASLPNTTYTSSTPPPNLQHLAADNYKLIQHLQHLEQQHKAILNKNHKLERQEIYLRMLLDEMQTRTEALDSLIWKISEFFIKPITLLSKVKDMVEFSATKDIPDYNDLPTLIHSMRLNHVREFVQLQQLRKYEKEEVADSHELWTRRKAIVQEFYAGIKHALGSLGISEANTVKLDVLSSEISSLQDRCRDTLDDISVLRNFIEENYRSSDQFTRGKLYNISQRSSEQRSDAFKIPNLKVDDSKLLVRPEVIQNEIELICALQTRLLDLEKATGVLKDVDTVSVGRVWEEEFGDDSYLSCSELDDVIERTSEEVDKIMKVLVELETTLRTWGVCGYEYEGCEVVEWRQRLWETYGEAVSSDC